MMFGMWASIWLTVREFLGIAVEIKEAEDQRKRDEANAILSDAEKRQKEQDEKDVRDGKKKPVPPHN